MTGLAKIYLTTCWAYFILMVLSMPADPETAPGLPYVDKLAHLFLFGVFSCLVFVTVRGLLSKYYRAALVLSLVTSIAYSLFLEYLQHFIPGRYPDTADFAAGVTGSLLTLIVISLRTVKQNKRRWF